MRFSAFSRFGHLRFSGTKPPGELYYRDLFRNAGGSENLTDAFDSVAGGLNFMTAMALARAQRTNERAGSQFRPLRAVEMLPALEWEFGITPAPGSTVLERQQVVAAAAKLAQGARTSNVEIVLTDLLGADFIAYIPTALADAVNSTSDPANTGVWDIPGSTKSIWKLTTPIAVTGVSWMASIQHIGGDARTVRVGSRIALDMGNDSRAESVVVIASTAGSVTAVFTKAHDIGTVLTTGRTPNMSSTKRQNLVVLSVAAMNDSNKRRKANEALRKVLRGVSTWSLCETAGSHVAGPFKVGHGKLNRTPIGTVSY